MTKEAMWVPDIRPWRATALTVPMDQPYRQAVREKLVTLLEKAGRRKAKAAVQMYLEQEYRQVLEAQFPDGWADQILMTGPVRLMVMEGKPGVADPADAETTADALEGQEELTLASFLEAAPI